MYATAWSTLSAGGSNPKVACHINTIEILFSYSNVIITISHILTRVNSPNMHIIYTYYVIEFLQIELYSSVYVHMSIIYIHNLPVVCCYKK